MTTLHRIGENAYIERPWKSDWRKNFEAGLEAEKQQRIQARRAETKVATPKPQPDPAYQWLPCVNGCGRTYNATLGHSGVCKTCRMAKAQKEMRERKTAAKKVTAQPVPKPEPVYCARGCGKALRTATNTTGMCHGCGGAERLRVYKVRHHIGRRTCSFTDEGLRCMERVNVTSDFCIWHRPARYLYSGARKLIKTRGPRMEAAYLIPPPVAMPGLDAAMMLEGE